MSKMITRAVGVAAGLLAIAVSPAPAAVSTFGSDLSAPATLDTAANVAPVPHFGADTALWNVRLGNGANPAAPADGQIVQVKVRGCSRVDPAHPPAGVGLGGTEIHFQDLVPQSDGSFKVDVTTQGFSLPICGANAQDTVTAYAPENFCVHAGDYVDFNDEGGFDPQFYPNGVPYQVIGRVPGSTMDSFIRDGGTNNGATMSPSDQTPSDGFRSNLDEELLLQATLATGPDATPLCPGGTKGQTAPGSTTTTTTTTPTSPTAPITLHRQTVGVNRRRIAQVAIFCAQKAAPCAGVASVLARGGKAAGTTKPYGSSRFTIPARKTSKVKVKLTPRALRLLRRNHRRLRATLVVVVAGKRYTTPITLKI